MKTITAKILYILRYKCIIDLTTGQLLSATGRYSE